MKPDDLADATARALDLLPPMDPARSDPRFTRDPVLTRQARETRETAADVWLAVSPLRVAPQGVLHEIMEKIGPSETRKRDGWHRLLPWLAASGWATAALVTLLLWPRDSGDRTKPGRSASTPPRDESVAADSPMRTASGGSRARDEILKLQARLSELRKTRPGDLPRVVSLNAPGGPRRSAAEAGQRIQAILTEALRSALEAESGAPADPASIVIERGWPSGGVTIPDDGTIVRHRNFPQHAWRELGLQRSEAGDYYDPASQMVWTADPEGRGFFGRKIGSDEELIGFNTDPDTAEEPASPRTGPEGFVIENPLHGSAEVVIDQVPPPTHGSAQYLVWTDSTGMTNSLPLTSIGGVGNFSASSAASSVGTLIATIPNVGNSASFQLVERPLVPNGQSDQIIVEGSP